MNTIPTAEDLAAQAVPLSDGPKLRDDATDVPLPPEHLVDDLDNQDPSNVEAAPPLEVATLDFFGDELPTWTHSLKYPFRWEGVPHTEIVVRQLNAMEIGNVYQQARAANRLPDLMEVYAVMTGLPAKVLRALPAVDGEPVVNKAFDFLPQLLRPASG